jgi:hypothetical protein
MDISELLPGPNNILDLLDKLEEDTVFTISIGHVFITVKNDSPISLVKTPAYVLIDKIDIEQVNDTREVGIEITPTTLIDPANMFINTIHKLRIKVTKNPIEGLHLSLLGMMIESVNPDDELFKYDTISEDNIYKKDLILLNEGEYYDDALRNKINDFEKILEEFKAGNIVKPELTDIFATIDSMIKRGIVVRDNETELFNSTDGIRDRLELFTKKLYKGNDLFGRVEHCKNAITFVLSNHLKPWIKRNLFRKVDDDGNVPSIEVFNDALTTNKYNMWDYIFGGSNKTSKHRTERIQKTKKVKYPSI